MLIFGLCFALYFLKLSAGIGFWTKLKNAQVAERLRHAYYLAIMKPISGCIDDSKTTASCQPA